MEKKTQKLNRYVMGWSKADKKEMVVRAHTYDEAEQLFKEGKYTLEESNDEYVAIKFEKTILIKVPKGEDITDNEELSLLVDQAVTDIREGDAEVTYDDATRITIARQDGGVEGLALTADKKVEPYEFVQATYLDPETDEYSVDAYVHEDGEGQSVAHINAKTGEVRYKENFNRRSSLAADVIRQKVEEIKGTALKAYQIG